MFCRRLGIIFIYMKPRKTKDKNPFLTVDTFKPTVRRQFERNKSGNEIYDEDGVIHKGIIGFEKPPKLADRKQYTKIYNEGRKEIVKLSMPAIKVLFYIMSEVENSDTFLFDMQKCMAFIEYKDKNSIYRAIKELKDASFIASSSSAKVYMINPLYFYNGDRIQLYKEMIR